MKTLVTLFAILALVFASVVPITAQETPSPGAKIAPLPNPKPGSWWVLKALDGGWSSRVELKRVENGRFITLINGREVEFTSEWNALDNFRDQRTIRDKYSPHSRSYSFPLWEGKKWGGIVAWTGQRALMSQGTFSVWVEVKGWEQIKVGAGTFDAIRLNIQSGPGHVNIICWYAPEVQRVAKCVLPTQAHFSWELKEFQLAGEAISRK